ncbi:MAG: N,N-dimethylformamidase beta subunit family domain-containing protein [Actinomycetota bacterium]
MELPPDSSPERGADDQTFHDVIEGYCGSLSYAPGDTATVHVSTLATGYDVVVERWGAERELVWAINDQPGVFVPVPTDADANGCGWPVSFDIPIGEQWRSGFYLVSLHAHDGPDGRRIAHTGFVVRAHAAASADTVLVMATNTWNAYNTWGGKSLYTGGHQVSFARPWARGMLVRPEVERDDRKSRPVHTGETGDADGFIFQQYRLPRAYPSAIGSTGWFTHARRFIEWAERNGRHIDLLTSTDLERHPDCLDGYNLVLGVGHDEYWSAGQRAVVESHVRRGGHYASFSGNTMFWQVRIADGTRGEAMVGYKYAAHHDDPVVGTDAAPSMSGMWADPVVAQPEWAFLGAGSAFGLYARFGRGTARGVGGFIIYRADHWMLDATTLGYGDVLGNDDGIVGYETVGTPYQLDDTNLPVARDRSDLPPVDIVAVTPATNLGMGDYPKSVAAFGDQGDLEFIADRIFGGGPDALARARHGNAVMAVARPFGDDGGDVVVCGSTDWVFGLRDPDVAQVTVNILDRYRRPSEPTPN